VKEILELPPVLTANARKIHEFWEKLTYSVQSLQTMNKLSQVDGACSSDDSRQIASYQRWSCSCWLWLGETGIHTAERGSSTLDEQEPDHWEFRRQGLKTRQNGSELAHSSRDEDFAWYMCILQSCNDADHKSTTCLTVKTSEKWRKIQANKKLCFNCTGPSHRAAKCESTVTCHNLARRHHTSICENPKKPEGPLFLRSYT
jgi:hypothetical protein